MSTVAPDPGVPVTEKWNYGSAAKSWALVFPVA